MSGVDRVGARAVAEAVPDPELPQLTLGDLGIVREVSQDGADGRAVSVAITPTYSGCPALDTIRADLVADLTAAGYGPVRVRLVLAPPWSTDQITPAGRRKLAAAGLVPPGPAPRGPVPVALGPVRTLPCPRCGSADTERLSAFGATACRTLHRCRACGEPFEAIKPV